MQEHELKESINMITSPFSRQKPFEAWNRLFEPAMKPYLTMGITTEEGQDDEKNPWMILQHQLWMANPFSRVFPLDPAAITSAFQLMWLDALGNPVRAWSNCSDFAQKYTQSMAVTALKFWEKDREIPPVIEPDRGDKRFSAPDWQLNPLFDFLKRLV
jgi:polyhydroxyalkanoate synthase subunit PhaC